jgi:DNA-binding transcriptional regulator YdaS (Cro superfamily)
MLTKDAIHYFGSGAALAAAVGISRAAVSQWSDRIPLATAARLEKLTGGALALDIESYAVPIPRVKEKAA